MDKNVVNISYYDTEKKTGGNYQLDLEKGNALIKQIIEQVVEKQQPTEPKVHTISMLLVPNNADLEKVKKVLVDPAKRGKPKVPSRFTDMVAARHFQTPIWEKTKQILAEREAQFQASLGGFVNPHKEYMLHQSIDNLLAKDREGYDPMTQTRCTLKGAGYIGSETFGLSKDVHDASAQAHTNIMDNYLKNKAQEQAREMDDAVLNSMPKPVIIMFNGPPRSGKDTACEILMGRCKDVQYAYFKEYLYQESAKLLGLDFNFWANICQDGNLKDKPMLVKGNGQVGATFTPRQVLIDVAETHLKPRFGVNCIAEKTAENIKARIEKYRAENKGKNPVFVMPDLGFPYEASVVAEMIPEAEVVVVHIKRDGFTFEGDSRNYVPNPNYVIINNGTVKSFEVEVFKLLQMVVKQVFAEANYRVKIKSDF